MVAVGEDADVARNLEGLLDNALGVELGVLQQGDGGGLGEVAAAADGDEIVLRLHHVTVAGDDEGFVLVGDGQQRLEAAQGAIGAPVLGQRHGGALQVALMGLQFGFEALEQGEGVGGAAGETSQYLAVVEAMNLAGVALHDGVAKRNLAIATDDDLTVAAN